MIENGVVVTHFKIDDEIYGVKWTDEGLLVPLVFTDNYGAYRYNAIYYLKIEKDIIKQIVDDCLEEKNLEGVKMRLIDADKLKNSYGWWEGNDRQLTRDEVRHYFDAMIDAQSTVEPTKRGKWVHVQLPLPLSDGSKECVRCSVCGTHWDNESNYCPYCGADMRGKENE